MPRRTTPHEQKIIDDFEMERTKNGTGKCVAFELRVLVNADGTVFLQSTEPNSMAEAYSSNKSATGAERAGEMFTLLCEQAAEMVKAFPDTSNAQPTP
jgi:hypothetical protein